MLTSTLYINKAIIIFAQLQNINNIQHVRILVLKNSKKVFLDKINYLKNDCSYLKQALIKNIYNLFYST